MKTQITAEIIKWIGETPLDNLKDQVPILTDVIFEMIVEEIKSKCKCIECNGEGAISTPDTYDACSHCSGTGFDYDGNFNDFISELTN